MSNICTWVAPLTIGTLRFFVRFKLGEREEENICYYKLSQPAIQTPHGVTSSYFETLRKCCLVLEEKKSFQGHAFSSGKVHNCYCLGMNGFSYQYLKKKYKCDAISVFRLSMGSVVIFSSPEPKAQR